MTPHQRNQAYTWWQEKLGLDIRNDHPEAVQVFLTWIWYDIHDDGVEYGNNELYAYYHAATCHSMGGPVT